MPTLLIRTLRCPLLLRKMARSESEPPNRHKRYTKPLCVIREKHISNIKGEPKTEKSEWKNINDLKNEYPSASILNDNRIVYNIKGNNYRLIVKFNFEYGICWIRFIGTHAEYEKIDANNI